MIDYSVQFVEDAETDLESIIRYVAVNDSPERAGYVLEKLEDLCQSLAQFPMRGHLPPELEWLGITGFREVHFKPYRIIYRIEGDSVWVYAILDGRRDIQSILLQRLLE